VHGRPLGRGRPSHFYLLDPCHRASAAFFAIFLRLAGVRLAALASPLLACCGLTGAGSSSDASPVAMSTIRLASWFRSRGRFGVERGLGMFQS
jgi:hypothetical protein